MLCAAHLPQYDFRAHLGIEEHPPEGAVPGEDLLGKALASGGQANAMIPNPGKTFTHRWGNTSETLAFERHS